MRTTYEDLLRVARRDAVVAYNFAAGDSTDLVSGWQATLTAARHHFRWLRLELATGDFAGVAAGRAEGPLAVLARSLGAGADLLASQNRSTSSAFEDDWLAAARSEIASITGLAARAAVTRLANQRTHSVDASHRLLGHLVDVIEELEFHHKSGSPDLGALRGLATTLPHAPVDEPSRIIFLAARWQSTHDSTSPAIVLTRDLRSTTAQLRTVIGYCLHLADLVSQSADAEEAGDLERALRTAGSATQRVTYALRTRVSDVGGRSDGAAEAAFVELLQTLRRWLSDGERLKGPQELVSAGREVAVVRDVVDELMHSAVRVAKVQEETAAWLILRGRLFVPKPELGKRDPEFDNRPGVWRLKYPQPAWVRTNLAACFDQLTADLAELTHQLSIAAQAARSVAGTSALRRPYGPEHFSGPPIVEGSRWRWRPPTYDDLFRTSTAIRPVPNVELSRTQFGGLMERPRVTPENLRDALHSEIRKHSSGVEWVRWLDASVALRNYSFRNVVLITLQMPYASQVARSDIWQKFGRSVLNQQQNHDIRILAPVIQHRGKSKPVQASDAEFELERVRSARGGGRLLGFKVGSVWDVSQTDGPPLPPPNVIAGASTSELWRALAHQAQSAGYTLVDGNSGHRGRDGYTDYQARTVVISGGLDDVSAVARLAHEVAHLRMHSPKEIATSGGAMCQGIREIEAESVAYVLMAHNGWSTGGSSFRHIASLATAANKREPERVIERTGSRVVSAARRLIESVDRHIRRSGSSQRRPDMRVVALDHLTIRHDLGRPLSGPEW